MDTQESLAILRYKFAEELESIVQCPICFDNFVVSEPVFQCVQGHHICHRCKKEVSICPYCKSYYIGTRNYLAEELIQKFSKIKAALIDPDNILKKDMISVQIQTELIDYKVAPNVGKGKYPCKIGSCTELLVHGRMIPHLRYYHMDVLISEKMSRNCSYENCWTLKYKILLVHERAIHIPNMGLFFLNVSINDKGDLIGYLQIVNIRKVAKEFEYILEISNRNTSIHTKATVLPVRMCITNKLLEKSVIIKNIIMSELLNEDDTFNCRLILNRDNSLKNVS